MNGMKILDQIEIDLRDTCTNDILTVYVTAHDSSLGRKWLSSLNDILKNDYHLEKNYCFFGFADGPRDGELILNQVNASIAAINSANLGYYIDDYFTLENSISAGELELINPRAGEINHDKFNHLHRYFEDLQGVSGNISSYYIRADAETRWHIRQLNLLCHEFESWVLSWRKKYTAPEWMRPSQLMCWLNAPRFTLEPADYELFGIETINRPIGGVFVGVNKAVGKHHWEVFNDEANKNPNMIIDNLTTTTMRSQLEAAGDFDIEWANNPGEAEWQRQNLADFRTWLINNGFDPEDKTLTIGHPQVGQVDLTRSFNTEDYREIWARLNTHLDVYSVRTSDASATYDYHWSDPDFIQRQVERITQGN